MLASQINLLWIPYFAEWRGLGAEAGVDGVGVSVCVSKGCFLKKKNADFLFTGPQYEQKPSGMLIESYDSHSGAIMRPSYTS